MIATASLDQLTKAVLAIARGVAENAGDLDELRELAGRLGGLAELPTDSPRFEYAAALDLPVHTDDAHRHLLPLSDWRFHSPVSYWDRRYHGAQFAIFELMLNLVLLGYLLRRPVQRWMRRRPGPHEPRPR